MNVKALHNLLKCVTFSHAHRAIARSNHKAWTAQTSRALYSISTVHNDQRLRWANGSLTARNFTIAPHRTIWTSFICNGQSRPEIKPNEGDEKRHTVDDRNQQPSEDDKKEVSPQEADKSAEHREEDVTKTISTNTQDMEALTLTQRFKKMYKEYWYVLLPVHMVTSCTWMGGLYYLSSSGVDIPAILETLHFSETTIDQLKNSSMGHLALAFMCYKLITPVRYVVTLGGSTVAIKYLSQWGYIKPVPNKAQLQKMYAESKAKLQKKL